MGKMLTIEFTEADKQALNYERFHHPHPRVQRKMEALWLKSQGLSHKDIAKLTGISPNTLRSYLRAYQSGGRDRLKQINFYRPKSELMAQAKTLEAYFRQSPPASIREAANKIEELTGIKRRPTQVRQFLKSIGIRCPKVGVGHNWAEPDLQAD
jgi:transposase